MDINMKRAVLKHIKMPLRYDRLGQIIFTADDHVVADIQVSGSEKVEEAFGKMLVEAFNEKFGGK